MVAYPCGCGKTCPPYLVAEFTGVDYADTCDQWVDTGPDYGNPGLSTRATDRPWCLSRGESDCEYQAAKECHCGDFGSNTNGVSYWFGVVNKGTEEAPNYYHRLKVTFARDGWVTPGEGDTVTFEAPCSSLTACQRFTAAGVVLAFVEDDREAWWGPDFSTATVTVRLPSGDECTGWTQDDPPAAEAYTIAGLGTFDVCDPPSPGIMTAVVTEARTPVLGNVGLDTRTSDTEGIVSYSGFSFGLLAGDTVHVRWGAHTATGYAGNRLNMAVSIVGATITLSGGAGDVLPAEGTSLRVGVVGGRALPDINDTYLLLDGGCSFAWQSDPAGDSIRLYPRCKPPEFDDGLTAGDGPYWYAQITWTSETWNGSGYGSSKAAVRCWPDGYEILLWYSVNQGKEVAWWNYSHDPFPEHYAGKIVITAHDWNMPEAWAELDGKSDGNAMGGYFSKTWAELDGKSDGNAKGGHPAVAWAALSGAPSGNAVGSTEATIAESYAVWTTPTGETPLEIRLHTADPGVDGTANEYAGGDYYPDYPAWNAPSGGYRTMASDLSFRGLADDGVSYASLWAFDWGSYEYIYLGNAALQGATAFGTDGSLTLLATQTKYATT